VSPEFLSKVSPEFPRDSAIGLRQRCTIQATRTNPLSVRQQTTTQGRQQESTLILSLFCPKDGVHLIHVHGDYGYDSKDCN